MLKNHFSNRGRGGNGATAEQLAVEGDSGFARGLATLQKRPRQSSERSQRSNVAAAAIIRCAELLGCAQDRQQHTHYIYTSGLTLGMGDSIFGLSLIVFNT